MQNKYLLMQTHQNSAMSFLYTPLFVDNVVIAPNSLPIVIISLYIKMCLH